MKTTIRCPMSSTGLTWQAELDRLLVREKAHTREGDAIAAARRRLPMVEVDAATPLVGAQGDGAPGRRVRGTQAADRLLPHVARRQARGRPVRGLHVLHRARAGAVLSAQPRRHVRDVLSGPLRRERAVPGLHGLGDAVVLGARLRATSCSPGARFGWLRLLSARRRPGVRDVLDAPVAARRPAPTATTCSTSPCTAGRRPGRTRRTAGRSRIATSAASSSAPTGGPPRSGPGSPRAAPTTSPASGSPTRRARVSPRA